MSAPFPFHFLHLWCLEAKISWRLAVPAALCRTHPPPGLDALSGETRVWDGLLSCEATPGEYFVQNLRCVYELWFTGQERESRSGTQFEQLSKQTKNQWCPIIEALLLLFFSKDTNLSLSCCPLRLTFSSFLLYGRNLVRVDPVTLPPDFLGKAPRHQTQPRVTPSDSRLPGPLGAQELSWGMVNPPPHPM